MLQSENSLKLKSALLEKGINVLKLYTDTRNGWTSSSGNYKYSTEHITYRLKHETRVKQLTRSLAFQLTSSSIHSGRNSARKKDANAKVRSIQLFLRPSTIPVSTHWKRGMSEIEKNWKWGGTTHVLSSYRTSLSQTVPTGSHLWKWRTGDMPGLWNNNWNLNAWRLQMMQHNCTSNRYKCCSTFHYMHYCSRTWKWLLIRPYATWKDNIKLDLKETGHEGMAWIQLTPDWHCHGLWLR